jgi:hypothetical protein
MSNLITYKPAGNKFSCGAEYTNLSVVTFTGPGNSKIVAYSCNINVDADGEPQSYAPFERDPRRKEPLKPMDSLEDAGWKPVDKNAKIKANYDALNTELAALEDQLSKLKSAASGTAPAAQASGAKPSTPAPPSAGAAAAPDPAKALQEEIDKKKKAIAGIIADAFPSDEKNPTKAPNFGKVFWHWYGVKSLDPSKKVPAWKGDGVDRRPDIYSKLSAYEDVYGAYPVVQSDFEPGPGYFVSVIPDVANFINAKFPDWDQRHYLPDDETTQQPFGAISSGLFADTKLWKSDKVFAIRLDTDDTCEFTFVDYGNGYKVAECSVQTYLQLGGDYHPERHGAAKFPNEFVMVYLAFPGRADPTTALQQFFGADNADEFPVMLAFLGQAAQQSRRMKDHPMHDFENWKKAKGAKKPVVDPQPLSVIITGLNKEGVDF